MLELTNEELAEQLESNQVDGVMMKEAARRLRNIGVDDTHFSKQSSPKMSSLAAELWSRTGGKGDLNQAALPTASDEDRCWLVSTARSLAASVLGQDETKGQD